MIFGLFVLFTANLILRLNDFVPGFYGFPIAEITIPILFGLWLLFEKKDFSSGADVLFFVFYVVMVAGYAVVVWPAGALSIARAFLPWMLLYFLTVNLTHNRTRMDVMFAVLYASSLVLVFHSWQQATSWDGIDDKTGVGFSGATILKGRIRYVGVMNDPNDLALFFAMMLPIGIQFATKGMSPLSRFAGYLAALPMLYGVYLSNSRGGMLSCGAVAAIFAWRRWGWLRAGLLVVTLAIAALSFGPSRVREQSESDEISTQGRIEAWHRGIELLKKSPVLGCGTNEFTKYHYLTAHNSFVLCFAENGFVGFAAWMGIGLYALYGLHESIKRMRSGSVEYRQSVAMFESLVAFYVGGFFLSRTYFILLPVMLGLAVASYKMTRDELVEQAEASDPALETDNSDDADHAQLGALAPLPNLSRISLIRLAPWIVGISLGMIVFVEFVVRIKR